MIECTLLKDIEFQSVFCKIFPTTEACAICWNIHYNYFMKVDVIFGWTALQSENVLSLQISILKLQYRNFQ